MYYYISRFKWKGRENHRIKSLTKASYTMLLVVLMYTIFFAYWWFICIANTLYLLGVDVSV